MEYVSAEWIVNDTSGGRVIRAIDDEGKEHFVPAAECDVPPWPAFLEKHGLRAIKTPVDAAPTKSASRRKKEE
jgi:hypothetical protein